MQPRSTVCVQRSVQDKAANLTDPVLAQQDYDHLHEATNKYQQSTFVDLESDFSENYGSPSSKQWSITDHSEPESLSFSSSFEQEFIINQNTSTGAVQTPKRKRGRPKGAKNKKITPAKTKKKTSMFIFISLYNDHIYYIYFFFFFYYIIYTCFRSCS